MPSNNYACPFYYLGKATGDRGPETPEVYELETEDQMKSTRNEASREAYRKNAELYKRWAREGK